MSLRAASAAGSHPAGSLRSLYEECVSKGKREGGKGTNPSQNSRSKSLKSSKLTINRLSSASSIFLTPVLYCALMRCVSEKGRYQLLKRGLDRRTTTHPCLLRSRVKVEELGEPVLIQRSSVPTSCRGRMRREKPTFVAFARGHRPAVGGSWRRLQTSCERCKRRRKELEKRSSRSEREIEARRREARREGGD
jgi:hypothetical protein